MYAHNIIVQGDQEDKAMALHLGVVNGGVNMIDRACYCVCGVMVTVRCPDGLVRSFL